MSWTNKYRSISLMAAGLFVVVGTYNAVVINSESNLYTSDIKFVKRLDELYGVTVPGRNSASVAWKKLGPSPAKLAQKKAQIIQAVSKIEAAPAVIEAPINDTPAAAIQEELQLTLVEVTNEKKWKNGLNNTQFLGNLETNNGVIQKLVVDLPNSEGINVSFNEMVGNVFEYEMNGELYSGMMYQVDQHSYMVTLSNGPLEGTRLRFQGGSPEYNDQQTLAQNNIETGSFGNNADEYDRQVQAQEAQREMVRNQVEQGTFQSTEEANNYDQQMQQAAVQAEMQVRDDAFQENGDYQELNEQETQQETLHARSEEAGLDVEGV